MQCIGKLVRNGLEKKSKINVVTIFNDAHRLFGVCTTFQCTRLPPVQYIPSTYPMCDSKPGTKEPCRSKYEGIFTVEGCQAGHKGVMEMRVQNFVTKFNHVTHLARGFYYMSMPNGLPQAQSQGGAIGQSLKGSVFRI